MGDFLSSQTAPRSTQDRLRCRESPADSEGRIWVRDRVPVPSPHSSPGSGRGGGSRRAGSEPHSRADARPPLSRLQRGADGPLPAGLLGRLKCASRSNFEKEITAHVSSPPPPPACRGDTWSERVGGRGGGQQQAHRRTDQSPGSSEPAVSVPQRLPAWPERCWGTAVSTPGVGRKNQKTVARGLSCAWEMPEVWGVGRSPRLHFPSSLSLAPPQAVPGKVAGGALGGHPSLTGG